MYSKRVTEHDHMLDAFEDALSAAADRLAAVRIPARELGAQIANFRTLMNWLFDGGWIRWGWPEDVGGLGGSPILRCG
jgi:alkylation response protein AidB-like acyl-CoA dehydrogenase